MFFFAPTREKLNSATGNRSKSEPSSESGRRGSNPRPRAVTLSPLGADAQAGRLGAGAWLPPRHLPWRVRCQSQAPVPNCSSVLVAAILRSPGTTFGSVRSLGLLRARAKESVTCLGRSSSAEQEAWTSSGASSAVGAWSSLPSSRTQTSPKSSSTDSGPRIRPEARRADSGSLPYPPLEHSVARRPGPGVRWG